MIYHWYLLNRKRMQEQRQRVRLSGSLLVVDEDRTRGFQNTRPQELSASPFQRYDGCIG